jgi:hypothetical protein
MITILIVDDAFNRPHLNGVKVVNWNHPFHKKPPISQSLIVSDGTPHWLFILN